MEKQETNWIVKQRAEEDMKAAILRDLRKMMETPVVSHQEILQLVEDCEI